MSWVFLIVAGVLEVAWTAALPAAGLARPLPTAAFLAALGGSMFLLARATEAIPLGTAYCVWVGVGAVGAVVIGISFRGDPASPNRMLFLALLVVSIAGLRLTSR